jgi:hypothetical protein
VLERVALHQTRLRIPGVGLDARGVALGARGLVLFPSLDRLVAFIAVFTETQPLDALVDSLRIDVVRSKLNTRELTLSFDAGSGDRLDRVAEIARLTGGFAFTGTDRHFVQYRDGAAPFGYDVDEVNASDARLVLYHSSFSQTYEIERSISLAALLTRLAPHPDPSATLEEDEPLFLLAEQGVGHSVLSYLIRSSIGAQAGVIEWPSSRLDDAPIRRWLFRVSRVPPRMVSLFTETPGVVAFLPTGRGVAVEFRYRHPVSLVGCPVFDAQGLVLFRGRGEAAVVVPRLPVMANVESLSKISISRESGDPAAGPVPTQTTLLELPLRLVPAARGRTHNVAVLVAPEHYSLLRRLLYVLGPDMLENTRIAVTGMGALLLNERGVEMIPLGTFFRRVHEAVFIPAGMELLPAVDGQTVFTALGAPEDRRLFFRPEGGVVAVDTAWFVTLGSVLLRPEGWAPLEAVTFAELERQPIPSVWYESLGSRPLGRAKPLP